MIRCLLFPGYERTFAQGLGILNALWKLEVKQLGTFGLARVRINEVRISEALLYSELQDRELDDFARQFVDTHPNSGERSPAGFLRKIGLRIQRSRIRESFEVRTRFRQALHRRQCNVAMPNSLWHIDGYHNLIRWPIVYTVVLMATPGCLCTFKPPITTNQKPFSVHAVEQYGLPSRVRCGRGGENVLVSNFILINPEREPGQGSCRTGRCVHNQRIERLGRDVHTECISLFHDLFICFKMRKCYMLATSSIYRLSSMY